MAKSDFNKPRRDQNVRNVHTGKSNSERTYYTKAIKDLRADPTLDESLDFVESDNLESDFTVPTTTKKRKISLKIKLSDHFENNWPFWVTGVVIALVGWSFNSILDQKDRISKAEGKLEYIDKVSNENKTDIKGIDKTLIDQSLSLKEIQVKMGIKNPKY